MVQILGPVRLMPGGLSMPTKNPELDSYAADQNLQFRQHDDQRAQEDQSYRNELRGRERAELADTGAAIDELLRDPGADPGDGTAQPPPVQDDRRPASGGLSSVSSAPAAAPAQDPAAPPIPAMQSTVPRKLASVNMMELNPGWGPGTSVDQTVTPSAGLPLNQTEQVETRPDPQQVTEAAIKEPGPAAPAATPAQGQSKLSQVSTRPDNTKFDMTMAKHLSKSAPGKAAEHLGKAMGQKAKNWEEDNAIALQVLDLADAGDVEKAMMLAKQHGETVDPRVLQNGQARSAMRTSLEMAKYAGAGHDQKWIERFAQSYTKTRDINAAMQAAGAPTAAPQKVGTFSTKTVSKDGKDKLVPFNTTTGTAGQPLGDAPVKATGSRQTNEQINYAWLTGPVAQGGRGLKPEDAQRIIFEVKTNPGARVNAVTALARAFVTNGDDAAEAQKKAVDTYTQIEKSLQPPAKNPNAAGGAAAAPAGAAPAAAPAPQAGNAAATSTQRQYAVSQDADGSEPDIYTEDNGKTWWHTEDDTRYDEGG